MLLSLPCVRRDCGQSRSAHRCGTSRQAWPIVEPIFAQPRKDALENYRPVKDQSGTAKIKGDASILKKLASTMIDFDPRFEIMPGTKAREKELAKANPYEAVPGKSIAE